MTITATIGLTNIDVATQSEAEAGVIDTKIMTPLKTAQAIAVLSTGLPSQTSNNGKFLTTDGTNASWATASGSGRELLTANRDYYVRTDGSNSNNGLANTAGGAFLTLQKAYDIIAANLDLGGFAVTVHVADGTYNTTTSNNLTIAQPWTGGGTVSFVGNTTTPANCILQTTSGNAISCSTSLPGSLSFSGFKLTTNGGLGIAHLGTGSIYYGAIDFGAMSTGYHIYAGGTGASIFVNGNYTISGAAGRHWSINNGSYISCITKTITLTGTPAISIFAHGRLGGLMEVYSNTYTGSATGQRYLSELNSAIFTNGGTLPGSTAGSTATGGQYS